MNFTKAITGLGLLALIGCSDLAIREQLPSETSGQPQRDTQKVLVDGPRLYIFDCGFLEFKKLKKSELDSHDEHNHEYEITELFVPCYLVEHNERRLFWDGGLPLSMAGQGEITIMEGITARYDRSVIDQLAELEISPSDIDYVAFSHMHLDHAGAGNAFVDSTMLIQREEFEHAFVNVEKAQGVYPSSYMDLAQAEKVIINGEHDIFGDGRVRLIPAPGHTPGHQLLWLDLEKMGPLILTGDLYHNEQRRRERHVPEFNTDREQTLESMDKIERLVEETGATLWISHDPVLASKLNRSPAYYE